MAKRKSKSTREKRREEALFRFQVVSGVYGLMISGRVRADAVRRMALRTHEFLGRRGRRVSVRTIYRWLAAWEADERLESLEPAERQRTGDSAVLPQALIAFIRSEKTATPCPGVPALPPIIATSAQLFN